MPLTDTRLRNLRPNGLRFELPDRDGLVLRVTPKGTMTWTLAYRVRGGGHEAGKRVSRLAGTKKRLTLGEYPLITLAQARESAAKAKRLARAGSDPIAALRPERSAGPNVTSLIERYDREHLRRNLRAGGNVEKLMRLHVEPAWGARGLGTLARSDLVDLLEKVRVRRELRDPKTGETKTRGGPGAAAEVRKWTRAMFQFAVDNDLLNENPFADVKNRDRQRRRDRVLSMDELRAVWAAAGGMGYPWGPCYRLILLTGDRRNEWASGRWDWLDPSCSRLEIPGAFYKTEKPQVVPLSRQAREILLGLPRHNQGPHIFSTDGGTRPVSGFSKAKARLDKLVIDELNRPGEGQERGMSPWVVHDLRRSMATHMERIGIEPHIIEVCLGHVLKGVAGTYRHYSYLAEKGDALQRWADEVLDAKQ